MKRAGIVSYTVISFAAAAALFSSSTQSFAYSEGPWCLKGNVGLGTVIEICHFRTVEQCLHERPFYGNSAFCVQNQRYGPNWRGAQKRRAPQ